MVKNVTFIIQRISYLNRSFLYCIIFIKVKPFSEISTCIVFTESYFWNKTVHYKSVCIWQPSKWHMYDVQKKTPLITHMHMIRTHTVHQRPTWTSHVTESLHIVCTWSENWLVVHVHQTCVELSLVNGDVGITCWGKPIRPRPCLLNNDITYMYIMLAWDYVFFFRDMIRFSPYQIMLHYKSATLRPPLLCSPVPRDSPAPDLSPSPPPPPPPSSMEKSCECLRYP